MKTLIELLREVKYQNANVKIGSKSGSSFWYCGKGNFAFSLPAIRKAREISLKKNYKILNDLKQRLNNLDLIYQKIYQAANKKGIKDKKQYFEKLKKRQEAEKVSLPRKIASVEYDIATHLLDRPVREVVYGISPDETPCWIIYVKGNENGAYWTIKEYEKKHKKELKDYAG